MYVIVIETDDGVWKQIGKPYQSQECARSWVSFVRAAWHAKRAKVIKRPPAPALQSETKET